MTQLPETDAEWREAVDLASLWLLIDSARQYGLITGGPLADAAAIARLSGKSA